MLIKKPADFSFQNTVFSHGWYQLSPFEFDEKKQQLKYVHRLENTQPVTSFISEIIKSIKVSFSENDVSQTDKNKIKTEIKRILRFDEELKSFYKLVKKEKDLAWIFHLGVGRLLRSPTVYEDLIKTICTTNCSWALTKKMVANLVEKLGTENSFGDKTFPTAERMAGVDAEFYRKEIRAGYRSEYFAELAKQVASGEIDPEEWLIVDLPATELKKEMKKIKGVGNYAAENLLKLIGRYDGLALDSFLRSEFYKKHNRGKICPDKKIEKFYQSFGDWKGLVIWFDMSKRWLVEQKE